ncbi:NAD-dependent deacetylase [Prevotella dentalis DSM 3688]|uniref:NAD-dependent deacetylase n=1 Tax=Prevotella dentalis (strain ATCC 49559 / DSM 3688 / JCM 13448 / NCTC 12043 / ES 2772) TaxID=908937 RepID=F9D3K0_PREDD|nr:NAD-dependent deacetylase [Prevotella dentalis DSM 3688]
MVKQWLDSRLDTGKVRRKRGWGYGLLRQVLVIFGQSLPEVWYQTDMKTG